MTTAAPAIADTKQIQDIQYLLGRLEQRGDDTSKVRELLRQVWRARAFDSDFAAATISDLLERTCKLDLAAQPKAAPKIDIPDGRYAVRSDAEDQHWIFVRVWNGDYATCVWLQVSDNDQRLSKAAASAVLAKIAAMGSLESAKAYGRQIGVCGICNRTLTNPDSISSGIGPVCAGKF